ncbi:hypothetical protein RIF29_04827 [Crotalaria pallida]|uniref:Uncharacterized protein n=1 Tax=Crotalaria pallida TaxID=3830 RepID=A0AAN9PA95_CROPI
MVGVVAAKDLPHQSYLRKSKEIGVGELENNANTSQKENLDSDTYEGIKEAWSRQTFNGNEVKGFTILYKQLLKHHLKRLLYKGPKCLENT